MDGGKTCTGFDFIVDVGNHHKGTRTTETSKNSATRDTWPNFCDVLSNFDAGSCKKNCTTIVNNQCFDRGHFVFNTDITCVVSSIKFQI